VKTESGVAVADSRFAMVSINIIRDQRLSINARLLYAVLKSFANFTQVSPDNPIGSTFVSRTRLAKAMGRERDGEVVAVNVRSIDNWLKELVAAGYLTVESRTETSPTGKVHHLTNRYHLDDNVQVKAGRQQQRDRDNSRLAAQSPDPWTQPRAATW
jgi:hypothetical protein